MKQHSEKGYNFLKGQKILPMPFMMAVLLHHRLLNKKGYPENSAQILGLDHDPFDDNKILAITQILTVADIYDSLTSERAYKPAFGAAEVVDVMTDMASNGMLDKRIVKALLSLVGFYPLGTKARIDTGPFKGYTAVVDANNRANPPFPMLRVTHNETGIPSERGRHNTDRKTPTVFNLLPEERSYMDRGREKKIVYPELYSRALHVFFPNPTPSQA